MTREHNETAVRPESDMVRFESPKRCVHTFDRSCSVYTEMVQQLYSIYLICGDLPSVGAGSISLTNIVVAAHSPHYLVLYTGGRNRRQIPAAILAPTRRQAQSGAAPAEWGVAPPRGVATASHCDICREKKSKCFRCRLSGLLCPS